VAGAGSHLVAEALEGPQTEMTWLYSDIAQRGETMKAIVQDTYGSTDVLELRDIDKPEIANDEVLVGVHAAGVDRGVWHVMTGLPYPIRLAGFGLRAPKTPVPGADVAGVVEAVGDDVTRFQPGDEVFGTGEGAFAEYGALPRTSWRPSRRT
jgi:NADPH:quinone reductase-like Zn-dependent oxidoreductase